MENKKTENTKTINVKVSLHKRLKSMCAMKDLKINEWLEQIIEKELDNYDNNGKDKS